MKSYGEDRMFLAGVPRQTRWIMQWLYTPRARKLDWQLVELSIENIRRVCPKKLADKLVRRIRRDFHEPA